MDYIFSGYATGRCLRMITEAQAKKLTHLNVAFAIVVDGRISMERLEPYMDELERIRSYNRNLNILLSTGGGDQHGHGPATADDEHMKVFVDSTMDAVRRYGFDGIDCDWEFPGDTGILEEKYQHTRLFSEYRRALDAYAAERGRKCYLTTAAGCGKWYIDRTEIGFSHRYLDFINLMTYDLRGWDQPSGHHTCLYEPIGAPIPFSADRSVRMLEAAGVPRSKLVMGAAFYSHIWRNVAPENHGMHQRSATGGEFGPDYTEICLVHEKSGQYVKYWDDDAKAPWLFDGHSFISYDDPRSIRLKCEYVKREGLAGMMYWQHGADMTGTLFDTIYDGLI